MAEGNEDQEQKTLEPSEKRLKDAYKKGQIPISKDLSNFVFLCTCLLLCSIILPYCFKKALPRLSYFISYCDQITIESEKNFTFLYTKTLVEIIKIFWIPFSIMLIAISAIGIIQTYRGISIENLKIKAARISPKEGLKRIFSTNAFIEIIKSIFKILLLGIIFYVVFKKQKEEINAWVIAEPLKYAELLKNLSIEFLKAVLIGYAFLGGFDFWYQRFSFRKKLQMTIQEAKEEHKESEGDPHIKSRIREIQRKRSRSRMLAKVPKATVIVTNPTHYSVALFWEEESFEAPTIIAKGVDVLAMKIREIANENKIPIIENAPVARSLYDSVEIDQQIPPEYYKVVAEIIRTAIKIRKHQF